MAIIPVLWVVFAVLCAYIGNSKGRSGGLWFLSGLFFGIFAVIAVCAVSDQSEKED